MYKLSKKAKALQIKRAIRQQLAKLYQLEDNPAYNQEVVNYAIKVLESRLGAFTFRQSNLSLFNDFIIGTLLGNFDYPNLVLEVNAYDYKRIDSLFDRCLSGHVFQKMNDEETKMIFTLRDAADGSTIDMLTVNKKVSQTLSTQRQKQAA